MARIIYKKGFEGQNKIECIEGIEIDMMNGQCALIYPKYADLPILYFKQYDDWKAKSMKKIEALKEENSKKVTDDLLALDSPAAKFVRQFRNDVFGYFSIPTLFTAMEIAYQIEDIDALAKTIEGADTLKKYAVVSSCSRYTRYCRWIVNGYTLFISNYGLSESSACVPTIVYKKPQTVYMVVSERVEEVETNSLVDVDGIRIFSKLNEAKTFAKRKLEDVLKIFDVTKDDVRVEESEKENSEEEYSIHANFLDHYTEWDVWVSIQKKEIE